MYIRFAFSSPFTRTHLHVLRYVRRVTHVYAEDTTISKISRRCTSERRALTRIQISGATFPMRNRVAPRGRGNDKSISRRGFPGRSLARSIGGGGDNSSFHWEDHGPATATIAAVRQLIGSSQPISPMSRHVASRPRSEIAHALYALGSPGIETNYPRVYIPLIRSQKRQPDAWNRYARIARLPPPPHFILFVYLCRSLVRA